ncbi:MAG: uncharacterized protein JWQ12_2174 [Glaciihabitans sp.]|nr:uncharacterized protein [Glaciihabitans sp.]
MVQTFLPFPDFDASAHSLDAPRLGKQRVEALQLLRASIFPSYGWQNHPALVMWRGYVPALTRYAMAMVDAWTALGHTDTTREQIAEFAPEVDGVPASALATPSWLGRDEVHISHQSNLVRKFPEFYGPQFPGVPGDLPYVWPGADPLPHPTDASGDRMWVLRPRSDDELDEWVRTSSVALADASPRGKRSPGWTAQLDELAGLPVGAPVAAIEPGGARLVAGRVVGELQTFAHDDGEVGFRRSVRWNDEIPRTAFAYPALLQDPRSIFQVPAPG